MWTESHYDQGENRSKLIWNSLSQGKILGIQILIILFSMQCFHFSIFFLLQDSTWSANLSALNELRLNCTPKAFSQQQELRRKNNQPYYRSVGLVVLRSLQSKLKLKKKLTYSFDQIGEPNRLGIIWDPELCFDSSTVKLASKVDILRKYRDQVTVVSSFSGKNSKLLWN